MSKNEIEKECLYLVRYINQETGKDTIEYFLAHGLSHLEDEIADIIQIQPLTDFTNLTSST